MSEMKTERPSVTFAALPHADGSADYEHCGYKVVATVSGPIEPQRRDELPDEAFIEVHVRESSGSGGPRTRSLEGVIHRTLLSLIDVAYHPRTLIQVMLQIMREPSDDHTTAPPSQQKSTLLILPHTLNAAVCALLNGNVAMKTVALAVGVSTYDNGVGINIKSRSWSASVDRRGSPDEKLKAVHVFAYTAKRQMLLAESEGNVTSDEWDQAAALGESECLGTGEMQSSLMSWLRSALAQDTAKGYWKEQKRFM